MNRHNGYSGQPGTARPPMVLVTEMSTGAFMVQGYPTGEAVYVSAWDAQALRDDLDAAFSGAGLAMDIPPIVKPRL